MARFRPESDRIGCLHRAYTRIRDNPAATQNPDTRHIEPTVIPRPEHTISRANISKNAIKVLYGLKDAGYQAHIVGGGVRDLLLELQPKDFDVATDAEPEQVKELFRNCRLIGRRFRLAHVHFGREIIEVATFRALLDPNADDGKTEAGRVLRDNVYGSIEEDAIRRDFTINALYYNIRDFSIIDYTSGMQDLHDRMLRLIGDPQTRYREDPVRMLRAARFAAKLDFAIHPQTADPIPQLADLLADIPAARLFDEVLKLFHAGRALDTFEILRDLDLFRQLFPATGKVLDYEDHAFALELIRNALKNTDARIAEGKPVTPAFLYAVMLWIPTLERASFYEERNMNPIQALQAAGRDVLQDQSGQTSVPRRFSVTIQDIWSMQPRFSQRKGKRALRMLSHPKFRAAYDFLCLRGDSGEDLQEQCEWWTQIQEVPEGEQKTMSAASRPRRPRRRAPRRAASG